MTVFVPLDPAAPPPPLPPFLSPAHDPPLVVSRALQAIMRAKRIVVICGAGISVSAGIPDFRSSDGLFQSMKRDNPKEAMSSGKELFDASVFNSENKTALFFQMIAQLSDLSQAAEPTSFHRLLHALDNRGRLLRVYTQNIDAIEQKSGLSFGVPEYGIKKAKSKAKPSVPELPLEPMHESDQSLPTVHLQHHLDPSSDPPTRFPSPPVETPRCIPLHGTLQSMHCQVCNHSFPLLEYLPSLVSGQPPPCPECTSLETTRQLVGKRPRGVGKLRPSVVLYNEAHKDGEGVGDVVQKDLCGTSKGKGKSGADLLLVVGTSLKVPGTKRMVREFAKAVKARAGNASASDSSSSATPSRSRLRSGLATPAPSPRRTPTAEDDPSSALPTALYLNLDFPVPTREWEGVFDAWIQGDAQTFADLLHKEIEHESRARDAAVEKKGKRKRDDAAKEPSPHQDRKSDKKLQSKKGKEPESLPRKKMVVSVEIPVSPRTPIKKKRKTTDAPPSPPHTPPARLRTKSISEEGMSIDDNHPSSSHRRPSWLASTSSLTSNSDSGSTSSSNEKIYVRIPPLHRSSFTHNHDSDVRGPRLSSPTPHYLRHHEFPHNSSQCETDYCELPKRHHRAPSNPGLGFCSGGYTTFAGTSDHSRTCAISDACGHEGMYPHRQHPTPDLQYSYGSRDRRHHDDWASSHSSGPNSWSYPSADRTASPPSTPPQRTLPFESLPTPSSTPTRHLSKHTKAGRKAIKEARSMKFASSKRRGSISDMSDVPGLPPPPPPLPPSMRIPQTRAPLRSYHKESFLRSSATRLQDHDERHLGVDGEDVFALDTLRRTLQLDNRDST